MHGVETGRRWRCVTVVMHVVPIEQEVKNQNDRVAVATVVYVLWQRAAVCPTKRDPAYASFLTQRLRTLQ